MNEVPINLKTDLILSVYEARILLSAEAEFGFERKNISNKSFNKSIEDKLNELRNKEKKITQQKLKLYGGEKAVIDYIKTHNPERIITFNQHDFLKSFDEKTLTSENFPSSSSSLVLDYFEKNYSKEAKQVLIDQALKKNKIKQARILSYSKSDLELLDNSWSLVSIQGISSSRKDILEKSTPKIRFDKETMKFSVYIECNTRYGSFILNREKLHLNFSKWVTAVACLHFKESVYASNKSDEHPKEELYRQQKRSIVNIINLVIGYEIKNSELILFTRDSRKLFFKKEIVQD